MINKGATYTEEEIKLILQHSISDIALAEKIGRSAHEIQVKRDRLLRQSKAKRFNEILEIVRYYERELKRVMVLSDEETELKTQAYDEITKQLKGWLAESEGKE